MRGDLQRRIVRLAAAYAAAGVEVDEPLVRRHRRLFRDAREAAVRILGKAAEIQQRGPDPTAPMAHADFCGFEVVATLDTGAPAGDGDAPRPAGAACPICGADVAAADLEGHVRDELLGGDRDGRVRVTVDPAFGLAQRELHVAAGSVREVKERVFAELGISVARQLITVNGRVPDDRDAVSGTTANLKYKKHYK